MAKIIDIIHKQLVKVNEVTYKAAPKFKPSYLGSPCLRKIYYSYLRIPEDFGAPLQLQKYAKAGNAYHELLSELVRPSGSLIDYKNKDGSTPKSRFEKGKDDHEFPLKDDELEISAKLDAVLIIDGKLWLGEWKTATAKSFASLKMPKKEHLIQGSTYLYVFNKALKEGHYNHIPQLKDFTQAEGIIFLYANKDDLAMKEFVVTEASQVFAETIGKILNIKNHVNNSTLPPKSYDWCKDCPWRTKCSVEYK